MPEKIVLMEECNGRIFFATNYGKICSAVMNSDNSWEVKVETDIAEWF